MNLFKQIFREVQRIGKFKANEMIYIQGDPYCDFSISISCCTTFFSQSKRPMSMYCTRLI